MKYMQVFGSHCIYTWYPKHPFFIGGFSWMAPNHYINKWNVSTLFHPQMRWDLTVISQLLKGKGVAKKIYCGWASVCFYRMKSAISCLFDPKLGVNRRILRWWLGCEITSETYNMCFPLSFSQGWGKHMFRATVVFRTMSYLLSSK